MLVDGSVVLKVVKRIGLTVDSMVPNLVAPLDLWQADLKVPSKAD